MNPDRMTNAQVKALARWLDRPAGMLCCFVAIATPAMIAAHLLRWWLA